MSVPKTQFTKSGDITIAYQCFGSGPIDLVYAQGWLSNIEYAWENPDYARFLSSLGSFSRVMFFDKRGTGLSDRDVGLPTLEQRTDDIRAVMEAVSEQNGLSSEWAVRSFRRCAICSATSTVHPRLSASR